MGVLILPTVISYSKVLSRLAIGLDRQPRLIAHLRPQTSETGDRETLPERAANTVRQAFVTCLNDRSGPAATTTERITLSRRAGIYTLANLCLKILFQCRKMRNAEQIITNIYNSSPALSLYPASQRVTYLYYLGRFLFSTNHFHRASLALDAAYMQCHQALTKQRRLILIYLIASNVILGRFPSSALLSRPEGKGLEDHFQPLCMAIKRGDLASFRRVTDLEGSNAAFFLRHRILLQIRNRCEVLVWRSLIRHTFLLNGSGGDVNARKAPTVALQDVLHIGRFLDSQAPAFSEGSDYIDPDLQGAGSDHEPPRRSQSDLRIEEIEAITASLISQGLLNGFISHAQARFAITGARRGGWAAGFPNVAEVLRAKGEANLGNVVPGWKMADVGLFGGKGQDPERSLT